MHKISKAVIIIGLTLFISQAQAAESIEVKVKGFVCALCGQGVEKKLNAASKQGIENYAVNMDTKVVSFNLKKGVTLTDKDIKKAVTKAGYAVENIQRMPEKNQQKSEQGKQKKDIKIPSTEKSAHDHDTDSDHSSMHRKKAQ